MKITSDFALLDVKDGRHKLAEHFKGQPTFGPCPPELRIPITIVGYIDRQVSRDDGTSIEFSVQVEHLCTTSTLEWELRYDTHSTQTPLGTYQVWEAGGHTYLRKPGEEAGYHTGGSINQAKEAAEMHIQAIARELSSYALASTMRC